jgi:prophage maintenance system killer protein
MVFLLDNGYELDVDDASIVQAMLAGSGGAMSERELAAWLRERCEGCAEGPA